MCLKEERVLSEKINNVVRKKQEKCVRKKEKYVRKGKIILKRSGWCVKKEKRVWLRKGYLCKKAADVS